MHTSTTYLNALLTHSALCVKMRFWRFPFSSKCAFDTTMFSWYFLRSDQTSLPRITPSCFQVDAIATESETPIKTFWSPRMRISVPMPHSGLQPNGIIVFLMKDILLEIRKRNSFLLLHRFQWVVKNNRFAEERIETIYCILYFPPFHILPLILPPPIYLSLSSI